MAKTFEYLKSYSTDHGGVMPSYGEIAAHIGVQSKSNISRIVDSLVERKLVRRSIRGGARGLEIISRDDVAIERERCAKIAEAHAAQCRQWRDSAVVRSDEDAAIGGAAAADEIATAIRRTA
jgi:DNA-binding MarR family transcriptional regulator